MPNTPTVAIVGGGALGAALASLLVARLAASRSPRAKPRVVLFEKGATVGRGLAYATDASPYLLNTSAESMSLAPGGRGGDFFDWLTEHGFATAGGAEHFCARERFGDYAEASFARSVDEARRSGLAVSVVHDEVARLLPRGRAGDGYRVLSRAHAPVDADVVLLAVGNLPSRRFRDLHGPAFFASPYPSATFLSRVPPDARVGVVGTGLSAIDAVIALVAAGHRGPVTMASRGGLLPSVRGPLVERTLSYVTRESVARETAHGERPLRWGTVLRWLERELEPHGVSWERDFPASAEPLPRLVAEIAAAERGARDWQSVGEALNPMMDVLWHHLADDDRRLFLDRYRSRFMSHWVPIPIVTAKRLLGVLETRRVHVERGLASVAREGAEYVFELERGRVALDFVIQATGVPRDLDEADSPLIDALRADGLITPHPFGGARVDFDTLRVLGESGRPDPSLFALGNLTCGTHLFTSTLDLNVEKANRVAGHVVDELHRRTEKDRHVDATPHSS